MAESITVSATLPATPKEIYNAWLSSKGHTAMTGAEATCTAKSGSTFAAWDGYIEGKNLELEPYTRIVQSWRTSEFPEETEDSQLEILLEKVSNGTKITLNHTNIPKGQGAQYQQGWHDHYFTPMKEYFSAKDENS